MKTIPRALVAAALALAFGCARPDWIEQTLVTVDVTGTWVRTEGPPIELKLEQRGSKVTGSLNSRAAGYGAVYTSGTLEGSVSGDVLRFKQTSGATFLPLEGEMTVSGDEMTGRWGVLRRVDSSRPGPGQP